MTKVKNDNRDIAFCSTYSPFCYFCGIVSSKGYRLDMYIKSYLTRALYYQL